MIDPYYRRLPADGPFQVFESTGATGSNWDTTIQHGSPPLALLTKAIEELAGGQERSDPGSVAASGQRVGRLMFDILGAIPVAPVKVRAWVDRPGARISLVAAEMLATRPDGTDRAVARLSAWLLATTDTTDAATDRHPPMVEGEPEPISHDWLGAPGYVQSVSWRTQITSPGDSKEAWLSPLVPLVDDEPVTDLQRLAMVVDTANGVGAALNPDEFVFMNTDTAVHLHRVPSGNDFG